MNPSTTSLLLIAVFSIILLESLFSRLFTRLTKQPFRQDHFKLGRYLLIVSLITLFALATAYFEGRGALVVFVVCAIVGPIVELLLSFSYESVVGQKLWIYYRYPIGYFTSWLTIPFWGAGGVILWLIFSLLPT